jgi:hypothetical protein
MKHPRFSTALSASALFACLSFVALCPQKAAADPESHFRGATYIITTVTDSTGAFADRDVITLNADHTLSVVSSGQGGPTFFFSSQLGTWGVSSNGTLVGRTIDFDYPPNADVARLDYTFKVQSDGSISGTITLYTFPLTANPLDGGGTLFGKFNFTGYKVTLP